MLQGLHLPPERSRFSRKALQYVIPQEINTPGTRLPPPWSPTAREGPEGWGHPGGADLRTQVFIAPGC